MEKGITEKEVVISREKFISFFVAQILKVFLYFLIVIIYLQIKGLFSQDFLPYYKELSFWLIIFILFILPCLFTISPAIIRYTLVRRFEQSYSFTSEGIERTLRDSNSQAFFSWGKAGYYKVVKVPFLKSLINRIYHQPNLSLMVLYRKGETGSLFSNALVSFDLPQGRESEITQYIESKGILKRG